MQSNAQDISKIIKEQIRNYSGKINNDEIGYVISVGDGILEENILRGGNRYRSVVGLVEAAAENLALLDEVIIFCGITSVKLYRKGSVGILERAVGIGYY